MPSSLLYLLVFHGSRDPRSQEAAKTLTHQVQQKLHYAPQVAQAVGERTAFNPVSPITVTHNPRQVSALEHRSDDKSVEAMVQAAYLECQPLGLHEQIQNQIFELRHSSQLIDIQRVIVLPVFLLAGVHVMEDIPSEIELAQSAIAPISIHVLPHLGAHPGLRRILNERMATLPVEAWILVAHGSKRPGANEPIEQLADHLGAIAAYWSTTPELETRLKELMEAGFRRIGILPFFLFRGGITDAIAETTTQFAKHFPKMHITLTNPLEDLPGLSDLLVQMAVQGG